LTILLFPQKTFSRLAKNFLCVVSFS
jgi:hypothetical protein